MQSISSKLCAPDESHLVCIRQWLTSLSSLITLLAAATAAYLAWPQMQAAQRSMAVNSAELLRNRLAGISSEEREVRKWTDKPDFYSNRDVLIKHPENWSPDEMKLAQATVDDLKQLQIALSDYGGKIATQDLVVPRTVFVSASFELEHALTTNLNMPPQKPGRRTKIQMEGVYSRYDEAASEYKIALGDVSVNSLRQLRAIEAELTK